MRGGATLLQSPVMPPRLLWWLLGCSWLLLDYCVHGAVLDPSDFLLGTHHRPRLEILYPQNGQVLDNGDLRVDIKVAGYTPSNFHSSLVCVGLSTGLDFATEQCFQQSDVVFFVNGLSAGAQYALRVVLLERGHALAVSVRHFRVGGVNGIPHVASTVTIKTALQVAVQYHSSGLGGEAEAIYREVLSENPNYADALHLLGMLFYQKGDMLSAADYVERALLNSGPSQVQSYHSTLGACYKGLGRLEEAAREFKAVLAFNPQDPVALFNLGLVVQDQAKWELAIELFRNATAIAMASQNATLLSTETREQAKIRECDLLGALRRFSESLSCWEHASVLFQSSATIFNELGSMLASMGFVERALDAFERAQTLGQPGAQVSTAFMHEQLGYYTRAIKALDEAIAAARKQGLPMYHLMLRRASIVPRVMPTPADLQRIRNDHASQLQALLTSEDREVDNASPLLRSFSLGYHYLFHGMTGNRKLKELLYRVYVSYCPALLQGVFVESPGSLRALRDPQMARQVAGTVTGNAVMVAAEGGAGLVPSSLSAAAGSEPAAAAPDVVRVGFISRFFFQHSVGLLMAGLLEDLTVVRGVEVHVIVVEGGEQSLFFDAVQRRILSMAPFVHHIPNPQDLGGVIAFVRALQLDVLVFPEQALDPLMYFMSFARLAPAQAVMLAHPDTTGVAQVDYFLTSDEAPGVDEEKGYSEQLVRLPGMTARLLDAHPSEAAQALQAPASSLGELRQVLLADMGLPAGAHLYVIPHSLIKFHPQFDDAVRTILQRDRLGYLVVGDAAAPRPSWQQLLLARLQASTNASLGSVVQRIVFANMSGTTDLRRVVQLAHVVLEPFPLTGTFAPCLDALAMGVPVVTLPNPLHLGGRFAQVLYRILGYGEERITDLDPHTDGLSAPPGARRPDPSTPYSPLVVYLTADYVATALRVAHQPALRDLHSLQLLWRRDRLFRSPAGLVERWRAFLFAARANHSTTALVQTW